MPNVGHRRVAILGLLACASLLAGGAGVLTGLCGPFTDVANDGFCPFVLELSTLGITTGTTPTTFDPGSSVNRTQMGTFVTRSVDTVGRRGHPKSARIHFHAPQSGSLSSRTPVGKGPVYCRNSRRRTWVSNLNGNSVTVLRSSDGKVLNTVTGISSPYGMHWAKGRMHVVGKTSPGRFYYIDPAGNTPTLVASNLGDNPRGIAWDGGRFWTANEGPTGSGPGSVSIVTPGATIPWTVTTVSTGFNYPHGLVFNGSNVWATDFNAGTFLKLGPNAEILQTVTVGTQPRFPMYDGNNFWVPLFGDARVALIRGSTGAILTTLTGNGLSFPTSIAHNGDRVFVSNLAGDLVSHYKMADGSPRGSFSTGSGTQPFAVCTDISLKTWIALATDDSIVNLD